MVTYTCKFLRNLSAVTEPLRQLIKDNHEQGFKIYFNEVHQVAFKKLKKLMTSAPVLKYYSTTEPITLSADASQAGLGAVLVQGNRPVAYASKALTDTERYGYSQIEKEMLALVFAFKKFHTYVFDRSDITVETDHLPLVRIIDKPMHLVPLRLQKMRMTLKQYYCFKFMGKSGKDIPVADALSRAYLPDTEQKLMKDVNYLVYATEIKGMCAFSEQHQRHLRKETDTDKELQMLIQTIQKGCTT